MPVQLPAPSRRLGRKMGRKGSFPERHRALSTLEFAETFHKTPALVCHTVRYGKPNCRCRTGEGHGPYWFLRWRNGVHQHRRYVKQADLPPVLAVVERRQAEDRAERLARALALRGLQEVEAWLRTLRNQ